MEPDIDEACEMRVIPDAPDTGEGQRLGAEPLDSFLAAHPRLAVALSGGLDSAYLLAAAQVAGCDVHAYVVDTAFQPAGDVADARMLAHGLGVPCTVITYDVLAMPDVCANGPDRCYHCKRAMFEAIGRAACADGFSLVVDGTNASDDPMGRPGYRALAQAGVVSPLRRAGMNKAQVRQGARDLGLALADKPGFSCLATLVFADMPITRESLAHACAHAMHE